MDYKTDEYEKDPKRNRAYGTKLKMYDKFWQEMSAQLVKEALLCKVS